MAFTDKTKFVGRAGEYLVLSDLAQKGLMAFPSNNQANYDIVLDYSGRLIRIEVKATQAPINTARLIGRYKFQISMRTGSGHREACPATDFDLVAFAFLDIRKVAYLSVEDLRKEDGTVQQYVHFRSRDKISEGYTGNGIVEDHMFIPSALLI